MTSPGKLEKLTMAEALYRNRLRLIDQLYDDWGGHYVVVELLGNVLFRLRRPGSKLSKRAALSWRNPDPQRYSLGIVLGGEVRAIEEP